MKGKLSKIKMIVYFAILIIIIIGILYRTEAASARVFMTNYFSTAASDRQHAINGFNSLGYSVTTQNNPTRSQILSWTNYSGDNYAFYISTHGPSDASAAAGATYFIDNYGQAIYPGNITGNWDLVYIDACNSKRNNNFPNTLNITGYSRRAYLGWATEVGVAAANQFNNYFWENYVTHHPIQAAAVYAAGDVPGAGTTPIRFAGDSSWYGYSR